MPVVTDKVRLWWSSSPPGETAWRRQKLDELVEHHTLLPYEAALLRNKSGATQLGSALLLLLNFFTHMSLCPSGRGELADEVAEFVARQVGVAASDLGFYDWAGPQIKAPGGDPGASGLPGMLGR